jgi:hypothetical protein
MRNAANSIHAYTETSSRTGHLLEIAGKQSGDPALAAEASRLASGFAKIPQGVNSIVRG